ncbi:hypothetical protein OG21DRAFT_1316272 [Imleria badia]|nr:hypothetical protein OG21DRAFT_1316272 [Imleria badia]
MTCLTIKSPRSRYRRLMCSHRTSEMHHSISPPSRAWQGVFQFSKKWAAATPPFDELDRTSSLSSDTTHACFWIPFSSTILVNPPCQDRSKLSIVEPCLARLRSQTFSSMSTPEFERSSNEHRTSVERCYPSVRLLSVVILQFGVILCRLYTLEVKPRALGDAHCGMIAIPVWP